PGVCKRYFSMNLAVRSLQGSKSAEIDTVVVVAFPPDSPEFDEHPAARVQADAADIAATHCHFGFLALRIISNQGKNQNLDPCANIMEIDSVVEKSIGEENWPWRMEEERQDPPTFLAAYRKKSDH
ncbi:hypothetical protein, partial [Nocardia sp. NPDC060259]|uniref:hypothetical protein n=1 Tax=Nocardia sp. NPDC060259 TaxID=3347088 RepID=UPI00365EBAEF